MDILKAFVLNGVEHNINILWKNNKPLFRASEFAKILEIKNISKSIISFDEDEKVLTTSMTPGGPQEVLFLTESGVYRLLMNSRKPIAKPFQKWVSKVLESIRETGKYELQLKIEEKERIRAETSEQIKIALEQEANKNKLIIQKNQHDALVEAFKDKYIVYFAKISEKDGKYIIKIGSTKELDIRVPKLIKQYETFYIFKVFECPMNEAFEKFLHTHQNIKKYKYNEMNSTELFLVTDEEIQDIIRIAIHNKFKFSSSVSAEQIIALENIKLKQIQARTEELKLINEINNINEIDNNEINHNEINDNIKNNEIDDYNTYIDPIILLSDSRRHTQSRGNKIQRYSSDSKTLIKTYDSYAYVIRDSELSDITRNSIKNAIKNNIIYKNCRWIELDRNLPDDTFQYLDETIDSKIIKKGYVAMLNLDKNKIINVFCDQKEASIDRKFTSTASISNAIKRKSISSGHYFIMWDDCSEELKNKYLLSNNLPDKRVPISSIKIEQLHPISNEILKTYSSIEDIIKEFKISRQTLKSACEFEYITKGYKWRILDK